MYKSFLWKAPVLLLAALVSCGPADVPPTEPPAVEPETALVEALTLYDADTDEAVGPLNDGAALDLSALPTNLSIVASTKPETVGSVGFELDSVLSVDNTSPYALTGDDGGAGSSDWPPPGRHTLTVTPFGEPDAGGQAGTPLTLGFSVEPRDEPGNGEGGGEEEDEGRWETLARSPEARQEVSYVQVNGLFYLAGGGTLHEVYNPATDAWSTVKPLPKRLDHIQGVAVDEKIYYIGGLAGWPEPAVSTVYIYDPERDTFTQGAPLPDGRARGAGGVAVYKGRIYYAGGLHEGEAVGWFDVYDPSSDSWASLADMPTARDHFQGAVVDGVFYAIGGRDTTINATTPVVEVYDFASNTWSALDTELPTPRGGFAVAVLGEEILTIGGEGGGKAYNTVEAFHTVTNTWRTLTPVPTARHGIQAAVCNGGVYVAAGGAEQGGSAPTNVHEVFFFDALEPCEPEPLKLSRID